MHVPHNAPASTTLYSRPIHDATRKPMTTRSAIATHFGITGYDAIAEKAYELLKRIDSQYEGRAWPAKRHDLADDVKSIKTPLRRLAQLKYVKIKNGETLRRPRHGHSGATTAACAAGRTSGTFAFATSAASCRIAIATALRTSASTASALRSGLARSRSRTSAKRP